MCCAKMSTYEEPGTTLVFESLDKNFDLTLSTIPGPKLTNWANLGTILNMIWDYISWLKLMALTAEVTFGQNKVPYTMWFTGAVL